MKILAFFAAGLAGAAQSAIAAHPETPTAIKLPAACEAAAAAGGHDAMMKGMSERGMSGKAVADGGMAGGMDMTNETKAGHDAMMKGTGKSASGMAVAGGGGRSGIMSKMTETQTGLHLAILGMHDPMMRGMMAKDADVAWICAMIPHHQGAIEMARAGLLGATDPESRRLAEDTIKSEEREIAKLDAWLIKHPSKPMVKAKQKKN